MPSSAEIVATSAVEAIVDEPWCESMKMEIPVLEVGPIDRAGDSSEATIASSRRA